MFFTVYLVTFRRDHTAHRHNPACRHTPLTQCEPTWDSSKQQNEWDRCNVLSAKFSHPFGKGGITRLQRGFLLSILKSNTERSRVTCIWMSPLSPCRVPCGIFQLNFVLGRAVMSYCLPFVPLCLAGMRGPMGLCLSEPKVFSNQTGSWRISRMHSMSC